MFQNVRPHVDKTTDRPIRKHVKQILKTKQLYVEQVLRNTSGSLSFAYQEMCEIIGQQAGQLSTINPGKTRGTCLSVDKIKALVSDQ